MSKQKIVEARGIFFRSSKYFYNTIYNKVTKYFIIICPDAKKMMILVLCPEVVVDCPGKAYFFLFIHFPGPPPCSIACFHYNCSTLIIKVV